MKREPRRWMPTSPKPRRRPQRRACKARPSRLTRPRHLGSSQPSFGTGRRVNILGREVVVRWKREHRLGETNGIDQSEEHTSELQSLMRISYAVFCLKKKTNNTKKINV